MKNIYDIINKLNINLPENFDMADISELLLQNKERVFFIDIVPYNAGIKYNEYEIDYDFILQGYIEEDEYYETEEKFIKTLDVLWLYNKVYMYSELLSEKTTEQLNNRLRTSEINKFNELDRKLFSMDFFEVDNINLLTTLVKLNRRNVIDLMLYYETYDIFLIGTFCGYLVYFGDLNRQSEIEKIVQTEGLYLRKSQ